MHKYADSNSKIMNKEYFYNTSESKKVYLVLPSNSKFFLSGRLRVRLSSKLSAKVIYIYNVLINEQLINEITDFNHKKSR